MSTNWRTKKAKKIERKTMIKQLKVRGEEHIHKATLVKARRSGEPFSHSGMFKILFLIWIILTRTVLL